MSKRLNLRHVRHRPHLHASAPDPTATATDTSAATAAKQVARINDLIQTARASWFGLLSYLAFVGVTLLGVEDADFFIIERQTDLPLIGVSIPTVRFFYVAPTIGAALYAYFHLHLLKLYDVLGQADRTDVPLSDRTTTWLVTDFALAWRPGELSKRPMRWLAFATTLLLTYIAGPLVLFGFWLRSMPYHEELLTVVFCGVPLMVALYAGRRSWSYMITQMRPDEPHRPVIQAGLFVLGWGARVLVVAIGWLATEGTFEHYVRHYDLFDDDLRRLEMAQTGGNPAHSEWWGDPRWDALLYRANLSGVNFVDAPEDWREHDTARAEFRTAWCNTNGIPEQACGSADPYVQLSGQEDDFLRAARFEWCADTLGAATTNLQSLCDFRFAEFERTFVVDWSTEWQLLLNSLTRRDYSGYDLRGADLSAAQMQGADLSFAQMQGADLGTAQMQGAVLSLAQMQGADLFGAQLQGAVLTQADLQGAVLSFAQMQDAVLSFARLHGADLFGAQMQGTILFGAQMQGAVLAGVQMSTSTELTAASIRGTAVNSVDDATLALLSTPTDWEEAFRPGNRLSPGDFNAQWRAFAATLDPPVTIAPDYGWVD